MGTAIRIDDEDGVRRLTLCRPDEYNTITAELRDALDARSTPPMWTTE